MSDILSQAPEAGWIPAIEMYKRTLAVAEEVGDEEMQVIFFGFVYHYSYKRLLQSLSCDLSWGNVANSLST
jgi:hypothetical protein